MWCLPNIEQMNDEAANEAEALKRAILTGRLRGKRIKCQYCPKAATYRALYYDIFSDDPKGVVAACDAHEDNVPGDGYFICGACNRIMVENYTWERYQRGDLCLNCARKRELAKSDNWIPLTTERINRFSGNDLDRAMHLHLLAVDQPTPPELKFVDDVEFDYSTRGVLLSDTASERGAQGTLKAVRSALFKARDAGHEEAAVILDGAFQFSGRLGIYVHGKN